MSMLSTRGAAAVSESMAILRGLAPDGGLYVPKDFPHFSMEEIAALGALDYQARALAILQKFLPDFTADELKNAIAGAYGTGFDDADIAPVRPVGDWAHALELWHGPTLAFKDMALQLLPHLLTLSAKKNGETREIFILVATSGDTGKAALEGFLDVPGTRCCVFYPREGVSQAQRLQMVTTGGANTHVIAVNGNFDDAQTGVKRIFADRAFAETMAAQGRVLSSANSINFGRLVPQVVYYFSAYADLLKAGAIKPGDEVNFCVPTGNFGDILAADYAGKAGLPVGRLICASNENNVLTDFINTGVYDVENRPFYKTITPSMDILVSSNLERLLFDLSGCDGARAGRNYYTEFVRQTPPDTVVLTLACGKYRFHDMDLGTVSGLPRLLDIGQCNDAYSAIQIALALAEAFHCGVNDLPLSMVLSWYEQKAVCILLTLLHLGIRNIRLGPTLPAFLSSNVLQYLVEHYAIAPITTPEADLAALLGS